MLLVHGLHFLFVIFLCDLKIFAVLVINICIYDDQNIAD